MQSQTRIFSQLVRDHMRPAKVVLPHHQTVDQLLARMAEQKVTSALVADDDGRLAGIITEQDVTRRIALRCSGDERISDLMTKPVESVASEDYLYYAIARMRRFGWHHMPVIDLDHRPVGLIRLTDALTVAADQTTELIDRISHEGSLDGLREVKAAQVEVAEALALDNVPAPEIQALISEINRDIHRRILDAQLAAMRAEGWGEPPVDFCLIVMGSGGRGENFLYPDQDNGFILDDYPNDEHSRIDGFFIELAERMTRDLDAVGFPYCNGHVMATNPLWRKTRSQWQEQIRIWVRRRSFVAIRLSDIFFDFRGLYGAVAMARELRETVTELAQQASSLGFLQAIQKESGEQSVALGWFGRFITEKEKPEHRGKINVKHTGTLPLIHNIRMLSLRHGVDGTGTLDRIAGLRQRHLLDEDTADELSGAFRHITRLLLRQQLADFKAGSKVTNYVHPKSLSRRERQHLVEAFRAIDRLQNRVRSELTADVF